MKLRTIAGIISLCSALFAGSALAYDCSGLPEWKRQAYYLVGTEVQYKEAAYINSEPSKRDYPDEGGPWNYLGACDGTGGGGSVEPQPISIYGAWHCGNDYCTWSSVRDMKKFDEKNHWLIDRGDGSGLPSVNLVVLSFVHPLRLLPSRIYPAVSALIPPLRRRQFFAKRISCWQDRPCSSHHGPTAGA